MPDLKVHRLTAGSLVLVGHMGVFFQAWFFFFFLNIIFYLFLFFSLAALGLCCCTWTFSSCSERGGYSLLQCSGFSLRWLVLLWSMGSRCAGFNSCGARAQ